MSLSGRPPTLPSYQNQFNNGIYVTSGPVVLPDNSVSVSALANGSDSNSFVTVSGAQNITGQKRFIEQILGDSIQLSSGAANQRVLKSDALGNASWQDSTGADLEGDNTWTGENYYETLPTTDTIPTNDSDMVNKTYVDGTFGKKGSANAWTAGNTFNTQLPTSTVASTTSDYQFLTRILADARFYKSGDNPNFGAVEANGITLAAGFRLVSGAGANKMLVSDTSGIASWSTYVQDNYTAMLTVPLITFTGTFFTNRPFDYSYKTGMYDTTTSSMLPPMTHANSNLTSIVEPYVTDIDTGTLESIMINFNVALGLVSFNAPNLINAELIALSAPVLTTISFPLMKYCAAFTILAPLMVNSIDLPELLICNSLSLNSFLTLVTGLSLPKVKILGVVSIVLPLASTVTFTALETINNLVLNCAILSTLSFPALIYAYTTWNLTLPNLTTFSFGSFVKTFGSNFVITGSKLDQASVDNILITLAALDGTSGTTAYSAKVINISGGTSATPSAAGLTAKATLVSRGCIVTNN